MIIKIRPPQIPTILLTISCIFLYACGDPQASPYRQSLQVEVDDANQSWEAEEPVTQVIDARPIALVDGKSVLWSDLLPTLSELAGGEAFQEVILDRLIARELGQRGLKIGEKDLARERQLLVKNLHIDPNIAIRLLDELRARQHLGPIRFQELLRRNASLRMMVSTEVRMTEAAITHTYDLIYGEKRQARLLTTQSLADAEVALARISEGAMFADLALELSTDRSSARGGLLEPISRNDSNYPEALRQSLWKMRADEISSPILIDDQFAIVQLVRIYEAQQTNLDDVRPDLERLTRLNQERLLMERLARRLMSNLSITFFDESIENGFRSIRRSGGDIIEP